MTTTKKYLVKFTPVKKFYFGADTVFNLNDDKNAARDSSGRKTSYIVTSNYFPQQTTLLGASRYLLLQQNRLLGEYNVEAKNREAAGKLIGKKGFYIENPATDGELDFGVIKTLSPVYIYHNKELYSAAPFDLGYEFEAENGRSYTNGQRSLIPVLKGYNAKDETPERLLSEAGGCITFGDVFLKHEQIGIDKNYEGKSQDNAFYKQTFLSFKEPKGAFAVSVELSSEIDTSTLNNTFLNMGGDGSRFKVTFEAHQEPAYTSHSPKCNYLRAVLLSDAFAENSIYNHCLFAYTRTVDFRCLQTDVNTENYYNINKTDDVKRSSKLNLLQKGSVFYFENEEKLKGFEKAMQLPRFNQIGYNRFYTIKPNQ